MVTVQFYDLLLGRGSYYSYEDSVCLSGGVQEGVWDGYELSLCLSWDLGCSSVCLWGVQEGPGGV